MSTVSSAERVGVFNDQNSAFRNSTTALRSFTSLPAIAATAMNGSAVAGGLGGLYIGSCMMYDACKKAKVAFSCGNMEGVVFNTLWGMSGAGLTGLSGILGSEGMMGLVGAAAPVAMTTALGGLGFVMNGALAAYGAYGLNEARKFGNELDERSARDALKWLNHQVTPDTNELAKCKDPAEEVKLIEKKWNALELRVGPNCAKMLREKMPEIMNSLTDLADKKIKALSENLDVKFNELFVEEEKVINNKIETLIEGVKKANFKQQVKFALFILLALVGTAALIAMFVSTGPASPILFAIGAALWLTVDSSKLHSYIGDKCWKWHCENKEIELTCHKTHLISQKTIS